MQAECGLTVRDEHMISQSSSTRMSSDVRNRRRGRQPNNLCLVGQALTRGPSCMDRCRHVCHGWASCMFQLNVAVYYYCLPCQLYLSLSRAIIASEAIDLIAENRCMACLEFGVAVAGWSVVLMFLNHARLGFKCTIRVSTYSLWRLTQPHNNNAAATAVAPRHA